MLYFSLFSNLWEDARNLPKNPLHENDVSHKFILS